MPLRDYGWLAILAGCGCVTVTSVDREADEHDTETDAESTGEVDIAGSSGSDTGVVDLGVCAELIECAETTPSVPAEAIEAQWGPTGVCWAAYTAAECHDQCAVQLQALYDTDACTGGDDAAQDTDGDLPPPPSSCEDWPHWSQCMDCTLSNECSEAWELCESAYDCDSQYFCLLYCVRDEYFVGLGECVAQCDPCVDDCLFYDETFDDWEPCLDQCIAEFDPRESEYLDPLATAQGLALIECGDAVCPSGPL